MAEKKQNYFQNNTRRPPLQGPAMTVSGQKIKTAVALSYDADGEAPKIIASGKGYVAEKMVEVAKQTDIPLYRDEKLANTLSKLELDDYIPPQLYEVVAEVLTFVDRLDHIKEKMKG